MPSIPPSIPPSSGPQWNPIGPTNAQLVNEFKQAWDNWYNNPSKASGQALLNFIETNTAQIKAIAADNHSMIVIGSVQPIDNCLKTAEENLQGWIDHGGNTNIQSCSEWVKDVYDWISYARGS